MSATNNQREMILKWHKGKAATPEYTAKLLGLPLSVDAAELPLPVVLKPSVGFCSMGVYVIEHPEPPKSRADVRTPECIEPKFDV